MDQPPQTVPSYLDEQDNELDLKVLLRMLAQYKAFIIIITSLITLSALLYSLSLPKFYKATVTTVPLNSDSVSGVSGIAGGGFVNNFFKGTQSSLKDQRLIAKVQTRSFIIRYIKERNLKPILFADRWSKIEKKWIDKEPDNYDAYIFFNDMLKISMNPLDPAKLAIFNLVWKDPVLENLNKIDYVINDFVDYINYTEKLLTVKKAEDSILFLKEELKKTTVVSLQAILYSLIEKNITTKMLSNIGNKFSFQIIDPAITPTIPKERNIFLFFIVGFFLSILVSIFTVITVNYFKESAS
jgi:hypothetical protein